MAAIMEGLQYPSIRTAVSRSSFHAMSRAQTCASQYQAPSLWASLLPSLSTGARTTRAEDGMLVLISTRLSALSTTLTGLLVPMLQAPMPSGTVTLLSSLTRPTLGSSSRLTCSSSDTTRPTNRPRSVTQSSGWAREKCQWNRPSSCQPRRSASLLVSPVQSSTAIPCPRAPCERTCTAT